MITANNIRSRCFYGRVDVHCVSIFFREFFNQKFYFLVENGTETIYYAVVLCVVQQFSVGFPGATCA